MTTVHLALAKALSQLVEERGAAFLGSLVLMPDATRLPLLRAILSARRDVLQNMLDTLDSTTAARRAALESAIAEFDAVLALSVR